MAGSRDLRVGDFVTRAGPGTGKIIDARAASDMVTVEWMGGAVTHEPTPHLHLIDLEEAPVRFEPDDVDDLLEVFRQTLGAIYIALADASGGYDVLEKANKILTRAVSSGAVDDPYAREAIMILVRSCQVDDDHSYQ